MKKKKESKPICAHCKEKLTDREIGLGWHFGDYWFCGNAHATAWAVEQIIKLKDEKSQ